MEEFYISILVVDAILVIRVLLIFYKEQQQQQQKLMRGILSMENSNRVCSADGPSVFASEVVIGSYLD